MTISNDDLLKFRDSLTQILDPTLVVAPTTIVATAIVSAAPTSYPAASLSVSSFPDYADVKIGHFFKIVNSITLEPVTWGVIRLTPTSNTLYIDAKSQGDSGIAMAIKQSIQANDIITIYEIRPLWTLLSRIANGVFFKKFNVAYDGSGSSPNPVVNIGKHQLIKVKKVGEEGIIELNALSTEVPSFTWLTKTLTTYAWTLPAEATVLTGTISSSSLTISLPQGYYELSCTITDSGSKSFTGIRSVWVIGPDYHALTDDYGIEIKSDETDEGGREFTFTVYGENLDEDVIMPGTLVAFSDFPLYDGVEVDTSHIVDYFVGFVTDRSGIYEDGLTGEKSVTFTAKSPFKILELIPQVSQVIVEIASPNSWEEVSRGLGNVNFCVWYILKHHTTYMEMFDYSPLPEASPPRKRAWGFNGNTIASQLTELSESLFGNIGSDSNGTLYFRRNPSLEDNTFRTALENVTTWLPDHLTSQVEINQLFYNPIAYVRAYALSMQSNNETIAVASIAPGVQQGQATGSNQYENIVLPPSNSQSDVNELAGHLYARDNSPYNSVTLALMRNFDICRPALMIWHNIDIASTLSPTGQRFFVRARPKTVSRNWEETDSGEWLKNIDVEFEPETFGQPGIKLPIKPSDGISFPSFPPFEIPYGSFPPYPEAGNDDESGDTSNSSSFKGILAFVYDGELFYTNGFHNSSPTYSQLIMPSNETVGSIAFDYNSEYFSSGNTSDNISIFVLCRTGSNMRIYRIVDIKDPEEINLIHTYTSGILVSQKKMSISTNKQDKNVVFAAYLDNRSVRYSVSFDNGANFDDGIVGTIAASGYFASDYEVGIATYGDICVTSGINTADAEIEDLPIALYVAEGNDTFNQIAFTGPLLVSSSIPSPSILAYSAVDLFAVFDSQNAGLASYTTKEWIDQHEFVSDDYPRVDPGNGADYVPSDIYDITNDASTGTFGYGNFGPWGSSDDFGTDITDGIIIKVLLSGATLPSGATATRRNGFARVDIIHHDISGNFDYFVEAGLGNGESFESQSSAIIGESAGHDSRLLGVLQDGGGNMELVTRWFAVQPNISAQARIFWGVFSGSVGWIIDYGTQLIRVTNYNSSPSWLDASTPDASTPERAYDITQDILNPDRVYVTTADGNFYTTTSHGTSWLLKNASAATKKTHVAKGSNIVVGGDDYIGITTDGSSYINKSGNLLSLVSGAASIRKILAL